MVSCPNMIFCVCVHACMCLCEGVFRDAWSPDSGYISVCDDVKLSSFSSADHMVIHSHPCVFPTLSLYFLSPSGYLLSLCTCLAKTYFFSVLMHARFLTLFILDFFFILFVCSFEVGQIFSQSPWEPIRKTRNCCHARSHFGP